MRSAREARVSSAEASGSGHCVRDDEIHSHVILDPLARLIASGEAGAGQAVPSRG